MVAVPTLAEEDAKRPSRERETLVGEASRIITRVKAAFVRLGIRSFNPKLKAAAERLGTLRTPEGEPIPPNTLAALKRDLERHQVVKKQIREIEQTRLEHLAQAPAKGPHAMCRPKLWLRSRPLVRDGLAMTVRGGGVPRLSLASMPPLRMGPPPRSFAADAHACIMVRVIATHRIQGCGASPLVPRQRAPLERVIPTQRACRRARGCQGSAWKRWSVRSAQSHGRP